MTVARTAFASLNIGNPLVAWLVYRGEMVASTQAHEQALGFWLMQALSEESSIGHRSALFHDELVLDALRQAHEPEAVSRLRGFYLFDDEASAERAICEWGGTFHRDAIAEVGVIEGSRWSRHDAQWISTRLGQGGASSSRRSGARPGRRSYVVLTVTISCTN